MQCEVKSNVLSVILVLVQARALVGSDDNAGVGGGGFHTPTKTRKRKESVLVDAEFGQVAASSSVYQQQAWYG